MINKARIAEARQDSQCVFDGVRFTVRATQIPTRDGKTRRGEFVDHPGAVVVLPFLDDDHIVMIRNRRFAIGTTLLELPAGTLEPGEPPLITAGRELIEETGYQAADIQPMITYFPTPGICNEVMHSYVAHGLTHVGQDLDDSEEISVEIVAWADALKLIDEGVICDGKSILCLLYAANSQRRGAESAEG